METIRGQGREAGGLRVGQSPSTRAQAHHWSSFQKVPAMPSPLVTVAQFAELAQLHPNTVYALAKAGRLSGARYFAEACESSYLRHSDSRPV